MRVVLDTNIFVSGLFFGGTPRAVLDYIPSQIIVPCFIPSTFEELQAVLARERFSTLRSRLSFSLEDFLGLLKTYSDLFDEPKIIPNIIKEDPADDKFLACALSANASFIISGDRHLLKLKQFSGIPIMTAAQFKKIALT